MYSIAYVESPNEQMLLFEIIYNFLKLIIFQTEILTKVN